MRSVFGLGVMAMLLASGPASAQCWIGSWSTSQIIPDERSTQPSQDLTDATLRQIVRTSIGGRQLRVKLSNLYGTRPLRIDAAHVALSAGAAGSRIKPGGKPLKFGGRTAVTLPAGAEYWSDPVDLAVPALTHVAITTYLPQAPDRQSSHTGSRATSYLLHGNRTDAIDLPGATPTEHWFQIAGLDVSGGTGAAVVTFGDSITDGFGVTVNSDRRWPDYLATRLQGDPRLRTLGVLNHGISGNRILLDGAGPNALARFDRDVLGQSGVRYFVLLEGVNDIGNFTGQPRTTAERDAFVAQMIQGYQQLVARAREHGIKAIGATILPYAGAGYYKPEGEAIRRTINAWIRQPGNFDAVIDFDKATADPADPTKMRADYDIGDRLHPSEVGLKAMADAVPLALFDRAPTCGAR